MIKSHAIIWCLCWTLICAFAESDTEADIKASINSFAPAWLTFDVIFMFVSEILSSWSDAASVSLLKLETKATAAQKTIDLIIILFL